MLKLASRDTDGQVALLTSGKVKSRPFLLNSELVTLCQVLREPHNFCCSSGVVRVNNTRRMAWVGDEPQMRYARDACGTLICIYQ